MLEVKQIQATTVIEDAGDYLRSLSIDEGLLLGLPDVVILPTRLDSAHDRNVFEPETKSLLLALRKGGINADLYDDNKPLASAFAFSEDVVVYLAFAVKEIVLPIVTSVIASIIHSRFSSGKTGRTKLEMVILDKNGAGSRLIRIQGTGEDVAKALIALGRVDDQEPGQVGEQAIEKKPDPDPTGQKGA